jgi:hypothetical protein
MGSFGQWARTRRLARVTWVCGNEPVLAEEVVSAALAGADFHLTLDAGEIREGEIWSAMSQPLADPAVTHLVVVRNAQRLKRLDQLPLILGSRELDQIRVLFVSGEDRLSRVRTDGEDKPVLAPHLALLRDSRCGMLVECRVPEDWRETPDWLLDWASAQLGGAGRVLGDALLSAAGSVAEAAAVAAKLRLAGIAPASASIAALAEPASSFTESVISGRRCEALAAAGALTREETGAAIGLLASRLDVLGALYTAAQQRLDARETAVKAGVPSFLQMRYKGAAVSYSPRCVASCRAVLAIADGQWRSGVVTGVGEFVAALWAA